MGGGSSKFDHTNWFKANGKLDSAEDTIDGAEPTQTFAVYRITKRPGRQPKYMVNQRDFDVIDGEHNLLYSTCAVPGTLAYFDVLGRGIDDYKLRVTADLTRRHWTVYRYSVPIFPEQAHDKEATLQLTQEHSPDGIRRFPSGQAPKLYKVCEITVSWSRYDAVAVMYGPPSLLNDNTLLTATDYEQLTHSNDSTKPATATFENKQQECRQGVSTSSHTPPTVEEYLPESELPDSSSPGSLAPETSKTMEELENSDLPQAEAIGGTTEASVLETKSESVSTTEESPPAVSSAEKTTSHKPKSLDMFLEMESSSRGKSSGRSRIDTGGSNENTSVTSSGSKSTKGSSVKGSLQSVLAASASLRATQQLPSWILSKTRGSSVTTKANSPSATTATSPAASSSTFRKVNPMEGVLQLDKPLLRCQEIYNHIIGTHQTMLVSKEQVLQMLKDEAAREREANSKKNKTGAVDENVEVRWEDAQALLQADVATSVATTGVHTKEESNHMSELQSLAAADESTSHYDQPCLSGDSTQAVAATTTSCITDENPSDDNNADLVCNIAVATEPLPGTEDDDDQPLVGYWIWENNLYTHKMKMHVAKGSDLALHVVLSILVNQVRYERNAIALTI